MREHAEVVTVATEVGRRRTFATALDWPGWCRAGRDEDAAVATLVAYAGRYADVVAIAAMGFDPGAAEGAMAVDVVERLEGDASTDFGAPGRIAVADSRPWTALEARRQCDLLVASWAAFDAVVASAPPTLRKGPRGGGRDTAAVAQHVLGAEAAYARKLGLRHREPDVGDTEAIGALRAAIVKGLDREHDGSPLVEQGWPPRYAARRMAWHVLDHAWEIEDRSQPS